MCKRKKHKIMEGCKRKKCRSRKALKKCAYSQDIGCRESRSCAELMRFIRFSFPSWYILFFFFLRFIFSMFIFLQACWLAQTCPQSHVAANKFPKDIVTLSLSHTHSFRCVDTTENEPSTVCKGVRISVPGGIKAIPHKKCAILLIGDYYYRS